jgi:biotin operon repressor
MNEIETKLLSVIGKGEDNAITQREITAMLGIGARETRLILERLRKSGVVICSSDHGRFFPENIKELRAYINRVQSGVRSECIALASARRLLREWGGES